MAADQKVTIVDFDDICLTNVNRQLHAMDDTVGRGKSEVMADRMRGNVAEDVAKMGLEVVSFTIKEVRDKNQYIENMGRPDIALGHALRCHELQPGADSLRLLALCALARQEWETALELAQTADQ